MSAGSSSSSSSSNDEAIQLTNNDACNFKAYAVSKGYWHDPYISLFATTPKSQLIEHKPPEMSLGYFSRVNGMRSVVYSFLNRHRAHNQPCQIINLGAGYDTLYFNLLDEHKQPAKYVEIDFARIVMSKIRIIKSKKLLLDKLLQVEPPVQQQQQQPPQSDGDFKMPMSLAPLSSKLPAGLQSNSEVHLKGFDILSVDLRNVKELEKRLAECGVDERLPTLILAECVLVYMSDEHSNGLLRFFANNFSRCGFVNYEQVNLSDKFGSIMLSNMQLRECSLMGTDACGSIDTQFNRFVNAGFHVNACQITTMTDYYRNKMSESERARVESLEFLDEKELLIQLMDHYCICIAANTLDLKFILFP
jgi:[phosphatase 2A protein]-leucine-carboxy methyltransferase